MEVEVAVEMFWKAVEGSSLRRVAKAVGVHHSTAAGWKDGVVPEGKNRELLIAWADSQPKPPDLPAVISDAAMRLAENMVAISQIQEHVRFAKQLALDTAARLGTIEKDLSPYVKHETRGIAKDLQQKAQTIPSIVAAEVQNRKNAAKKTAKRKDRKQG